MEYDIDNYEVAKSASVTWARDEDGKHFILLTINNKIYRLTVDQSWRLGDKLREV